MLYLTGIDFGEFILATPSGAVVTGEGKLLISGDMPNQVHGEIIELYKQGFDETGENGLTPIQLIAIVDSMLANTPKGDLVIASQTQGNYLFANHPAFMPEVVEI